MPAVHVRNVPEPLLADLKRRASANQRSLQREVLVILEAAAAEAPPPEPLAPIRLVMASEEAAAGDWSREAIYGDDGR